MGVPSFRRDLEYRCDPHGLGHSLMGDDSNYYFDNRQRQPMLLFQWTVAGTGCFRQTDSGVDTDLPPGTGFLVNIPSPTHYFVPPGATWEFFYVSFSGRLAEYHVERLLQAHGPIFALGEEHRVETLLQQMYLLALEGDGFDEFRASALLYELLMELSRQASPASLEDAPEELRHARLYMEHHLGDEDLGLEEVAAVAGYSPFHFTRLFKQWTGLSPHAYLIRLRVQHAFELLVSTDLATKEIAARVGYRDAGYFGRLFKKHTQLTPGTVRTRRQPSPGPLIPGPYRSAKSADPCVIPHPQEGND